MELEKKNDNITYELGGELVFTVMLIWRQVHVIIAMFLPRKDVELLERGLHIKFQLPSMP